ncbi:MAG: hypothetical protein ACXVED_11010 [Bacteroidia bacterium]
MLKNVQVLAPFMQFENPRDYSQPLPFDRQSAPEIVKNGVFRLKNSPKQGEYVAVDSFLSYK